MRCPHCGRRIDYEHIPPGIRRVAERAGLPRPLWYAGQTFCPYYKRKHTLASIAAALDEKQGPSGGER